MRYTVNLDCKTKHVAKDGTFPILLRVSINGIHGYVNTGRRIKEGHYDKVKKAVKDNIKGFGVLNAFIDRQKVEICNIIADFESKGLIATVDKVKELYNKETGKIKTLNFCKWVEKRIEWEEEHSQLSEGTIRYYKNNNRMLSEYRSNLGIHDIDEKFLEEYRSHVTSTLGLSENSGFHAMNFLRKYTGQLFKEGKIKKYPFDNYVVGEPFEVDPEYLEPDELALLDKLYYSNELKNKIKLAKSKHARDFGIGLTYQFVLKYFLASCYCGLRWSDIKTLTTEHCKNEFIVKKVTKGKKKRHKIVRIPIRRKLKALINSKDENELPFEGKVFENSYTNKMLKEIMEIAGIKKNITFHAARHTFAINSLLLGISIEVVSDILGHSMIKTTQRYARIIDPTRNKEMDKWDDF